MKKVLIALYGLLLGTLGICWLFIGITAAFPDSGPGSKDWEEDKIFIPFGFVMLLIWLTIMVFSFYKFRKSKSNILTFVIPFLIGVIIFLSPLFIQGVKF